MTPEQEAALRHARMIPRELREEEGITDWAALYDYEMEVLADLCEQQAQEIERLTALARELAHALEDADGSYQAELRRLTVLARPDVRALRKAFPQELSGLYTSDEIADEPKTPALVVESASADRAPLPPGAVYVERVSSGPTRNKSVTRWQVVLSTGEECTTIKATLGQLAEQIAQEGVAVVAETQKGKFGLELVNLTRVAPAADPAALPPDELTAGEIPL